jgi:hypothetical protein
VASVPVFRRVTHGSKDRERRYHRRVVVPVTNKGTKAVATKAPVQTLAVGTESVEIPAWTKREATKPVDRKTFESDVEALAAAGRSLVKVGEPIMIQQALHIGNAVDVSNLVGTKDGQPYAGLEALGNAFGLASKGQVSRYVRMYRAHVHHGVRVGSADWTMLSKFGDAGLFTPILGKAEPVAKDEFRKGMERARDLIRRNGDKAPSGERVKALESGKAPSREAQPDEGDKASKAETKAKAEAKPMVTTADVRTVLAGIESWLKSADETSATTVRKDLVRIAEGDIRRRKALADKAAQDKGKAEGEGKAETPKPKPPVKQTEPAKA